MSIFEATILPVGDLVAGTHVVRALRQARAVEGWDAGQVRALQLAKLNHLLLAARANVAFYSEWLKGLRLPLSDIGELAELPTITKREINDGYSSGSMIRANLRNGYRKICSSSGSTGHVTRSLRDAGHFSAGWAAFFRNLGWMGVTPGARQFSLWGNPILPAASGGIGSKARELLFGRRMVSAFDMADDRLAEYAEEMRRYRPAWVRGYAGALADLARVVAATGGPPPGLIAVSSTAEPLSPTQRAAIVEGFGVPVFDQYACSECLSMAHECAYHDGLHVNEDVVLVEILGPDGQPAPPGVTGDIVLTNLDNHLMPFIRYRNGDRGYRIEGDCRCGRPFGRIGIASARTIDFVVTPSGRKVHGEYFIHLLNESGWTRDCGIRGLQIVQPDPSTLRWRLAADRPASEAERRRMDALVHTDLGIDTNIWEWCDAIERAGSGKHRFILREFDTAG